MPTASLTAAQPAHTPRQPTAGRETSAPTAASSIFISYAHEDSNFVEFLVEMLRVHRLQPWHDADRVLPQRGKPRVMDHVLEGIRSSDAMVLVASPHTLRSEWVPKELKAFVQDKADPSVIPAVIAPCDLRGIGPELEERVCLEFHKDMLSSFRKLMKTFGCEWLPLIDQRHARGERRSLPNYERLEFALCQVVKRRGLPLTQALPFEDQHGQLLGLLEGFQAQIQKSYRLLDPATGRETIVTANTFRDAMLRAIEGRALEHLVPAFLVKAVVAELGLRNRVEARDRRKVDKAQGIAGSGTPSAAVR